MKPAALAGTRLPEATTSRAFDQTSPNGGIREGLPMPSTSVKPKPAVADRLDRAHGGVAVVVAPGGYGKTSQVSLWARHDRRTLAWADLEPSDDDPERLLDVFIEALRPAEDLRVGMPRSARSTAHQYATRRRARTWAGYPAV